MVSLDAVLIEKPIKVTYRQIPRHIFRRLQNSDSSSLLGIFLATPVLLSPIPKPVSSLSLRVGHITGCTSYGSAPSLPS